MGQGLGERRPWTRTSASQDIAFQRCQRYWFYGWVERLKGPPTEAQLRGTNIHTEIEHYLNTGELRDSNYGGQNFRPYVEAVAAFLPPPAHEELVIEFPIKLDTPLGPGSWIGFIDAAFSGAEPLRLLDTKSTSDFRYCKTPKELGEDNIQLASYGKAVYEMGHKGPIEVGHVYVKTGKRVPKRPKSKIVTALVTLDEIGPQWDAAMERVELMREASLADEANDLPPTPSACSMYGGCPHRARCGLVGETSLGGFFNNKANEKKKQKENVKMANSFLARLKGNKKSKKTTTEEGAKGPLPPDAPSRETPVEDKEPAPKPDKKKKTTRKRKKNGTAAGFAIFIDCMPIKGEGDAVMFEDWMVPVFKSLNETVAEEKNLPSYLLLPFAEEKAMLSMAITESLETLPGVMVVNSSSPAARDALGVLIPHAARVVRAVR